MFFPCEWRGTIRNIYRHAASKYWTFAPGLASDRDLNCASIVLQLLPLRLWSQLPGASHTPGQADTAIRNCDQDEKLLHLKNIHTYLNIMNMNKCLSIYSRFIWSSGSRLRDKCWLCWYKTNCKNNHCLPHKTHTLSLGNGLYHGWFMKPKVGW